MGCPGRVAPVDSNMNHQFGWIALSLGIPLFIGAWGLLTISHPAQGWLLLLFVIAFLAAGAFMEGKTQEELAERIPLAQEGRQHVVVGLRDTALTVVGTALGIGFLVGIIGLLKSLG